MEQAPRKNAARIKHLREKYVRFPLDLKPEVLNRFKEVCQQKGTTPTTEIKRFIREYCGEAEE